MTYHIRIFETKGKKLIEEIETNLPVLRYINESYIKQENNVSLNELIVFYY
jgi:hypothetical protein